MAIEVASLYATLGLVDNLSPGLRRADGGLGAFGRNLQSVGLNLGLLTAPLVAVGVQGVRTAADFDSAMAEISARTGATGSDLDLIRETALRMGADTVFSAQQAAQALLEILSSGSSVAEALDILPFVLDGAAASGEDLGRTADSVTDILAAFGLEGRDSRRVVDALSRAAGASSATMGDLMESYSNVGGVAAQFGLSVEDTAAILAVFAENGVKGAEAGTQLRSMLNNMARDTEDAHTAWAAFGTSLYDSEGNIRPLETVIDDISAAMAGMTDQERITAIQQLAGTYGQLGLTALTGSVGIGEMAANMGEQASAADVAAARMETFNGRMDSLTGSIETAMINAFTPFMDLVLTPIVGKITDVINALGAWALENPQTAITIISVVGAVALFAAGLAIAGTVISTVAGLVGTLVTIGLGPLGLALLVGVGLVAAYTNNWGGFRDFVNTYVLPLLELVRDAVEAVNAGIEQFPNLQFAGLGTAIGGNLAIEAGAFSGTAPNPAVGGANVVAYLLSLFRANGGPVSGGSPYIVGERGPELFVPGSSGNIISNGAMGGMGGNTYYIQMPPDALRDEAAARRRGRDFGEAFAEQQRARGYQP